MTQAEASMGLEWLQAPVCQINTAQRQAAQQRQSELTKPAGALGRLEQLAIQLAGLQGRARPQVERVEIALFAADHGVVAEGVSAYPQVVTAEMLRNFARGGAAISVAAQALGARLRVYNLGTVSPLEPLAGVIECSVAPQTANFCQQPAMTPEQLALALAVGREAVTRLEPCDLFIGGEMGIGNTTAASALAAVLLQQPVSELVGPGTGLDAAGMQHKCAVIERALALHQPDPQAPLELLRCLGGFEIAALVGAYLACAQRGIAVLVDGFICSVAALLACRLQPASAEWMIFAHRSAEPGYAPLAAALPALPLLDLGLRLGEGSGAAVAVPLLRMACALHAGMATFAEAAVSQTEAQTDLQRNAQPQPGEPAAQV